MFLKKKKNYFTLIENNISFQDSEVGIQGNSILQPEKALSLTGHSMRRQAWVLMGADLNKMLKPGYKSLYKHAG